MHIVCVVGARPNYMKVAPVLEALRRRGHRAPLVHTGQHYDASMSDVFFQDLGLPPPDVNLGVGSGSHAVQTARVLEAFEPVLTADLPDFVLVAGDVNSTLACALVAQKLHVRVAHLEAGLRSGDRRMPEEVNRLLTDQLSDVLLTPSPDADEHLAHEGIPAARIHRVGNAMIDSLVRFLPRARERDTLQRLGLTAGAYALVTLHRPSNVDEPAVLDGLLAALGRIAQQIPVLFVTHPRAKDRLAAQGGPPRGLRFIEPLGYLDFLAVQAGAKLVLTDSGGLQEETTVLRIPCLTLRENTERPITVTEGTNTVVGVDPARIVREAEAILAGSGKQGRVPDLWDGATGARVAAVFEALS